MMESQFEELNISTGMIKSSIISITPKTFTVSNPGQLNPSGIQPPNGSVF